MANHMTRLIKRDGLKCHYCKCVVQRSHGNHQANCNNPTLATKDHVVPKSMGGLGKVENYVIACKTCNETRGDNLYYCACAFCADVVESFMQRCFGGTFGVVKPRVWKHHDGWVISIGLNSFYRKSWNGAMSAVPSAERANV